MACVESSACRAGVIGSLEQVRVGRERDRWVGVAELPGDVDDVQPPADQQRGEGVPERVQREPSGCGDARGLDGGAEGFAGVAVVEPAHVAAAKDELLGPLVAGGEPLFPQQLGDRGGEHDLAPSRRGLERRVDALAGELAVDAQELLLVVDVGPGKPEGFADPQAGVGRGTRTAAGASEEGEQKEARKTLRKSRGLRSIQPLDWSEAATPV